jgi:catechol 2,3-dioxygenase-like lactoylglutathione lyase family enzyme
MGLQNSRVEAAIAASDLAKAKHFYEDQLGLTPSEEDETGVRYPCGEGTGIFVYLSVENAGQSQATMAGWFVDDLDETMADLASRGVTFERYDQPDLKTDEGGVFDGGDFRATWIKDPDGNTLAITAVASAG